MKTNELIVDLGRGPQLSTSRITVQDVVPYWQAGCDDEEIIQWLPTLTRGELAILKDYYLAHQEKCDQKERAVQAFREEQIRLQRLRFPESQESSLERFQRLRKLLHERFPEANGEGNPG
jgi:uncharacterized protein (DUF433 family)